MSEKKYRKMSEKKELFTFPGEHIYNGVRFGFIFPAEILDRLKTFKINDNDVLVVGFPKSGIYIHHILSPLL